MLGPKIYPWVSVVCLWRGMFNLVAFPGLKILSVLSALRYKKTFGGKNLTEDRAKIETM